MKKILCLLCLFLLSSCVTQKFDFSSKVGTLTYAEKQNFRFLGILQTNYLHNPQKHCDLENKSLARIEFKQTFKDIMTTVFTATVITPRTVEIYCLSKN